MPHLKLIVLSANITDFNTLSFACRSDVLGCLLLLRRLNLGSDQALFGLAPVDDGPHLLEVVGARVLVVQVVRVLPDVHVDDGHQVWAHISDEILVSSGAEGQRILALVVDEPTPA